MGCFFACLRVRDDGSRPNLASPSSKPSERSVSRNRLSSLFIDEDRRDYPSHKLRSPQIDKDLKDEAKGHSSLSNKSTDKSQLDKPHQPPTPIKLSEALVRRSGSPDNLPNSCISNAVNIGSFSIDSTERSETTTVDKTIKIDVEPISANGWNKSVRFECEHDTSSFKYGDQNTNKVELLSSQSALKPSPNTTPLKLSDEMQNPGTVFPSNGKIRIKSGDVHSVLYPVENATPKEILGELKESHERPEEATPKVEIGVKQASLTKESEEEGSLSSWFKPKQYTIDDHIRNLQAASTKLPHSGKTLVDRPIIGMVAAHWNEDESSRISPKWWDGNGIPNSTNKYNEDQKVSWHATPFEERLEKALSDESLISKSKQVNRTPAFGETDESDTALSRLRPSPHSKSVVSF